MQELQEGWFQSLGWEKSPGGGHGNPLQYSCLEHPTDRGASQALVHRVAKSWTWLKWLSTRTIFIEQICSLLLCCTVMGNQSTWKMRFSINWILLLFCVKITINNKMVILFLWHLDHYSKYKWLCNLSRWAFTSRRLELEWEAGEGTDLQIRRYITLNWCVLTLEDLRSEVFPKITISIFFWASL